MTRKAKSEHAENQWERSRVDERVLCARHIAAAEERIRNLRIDSTSTADNGPSAGRRYPSLEASCMSMPGVTKLPQMSFRSVVTSVQGTTL